MSSYSNLSIPQTKSFSELFSILCETQRSSVALMVREQGEIVKKRWALT